MATVQQKREKNTPGRRHRLSQGQEERKHRGVQGATNSWGLLESKWGAGRGKGETGRVRGGREGEDKAGKEGGVEEGREGEEGQGG